MMDDKIRIKAEVDMEQINEFPANVIIKNAKNCTFNIYPSQTRLYEVNENDQG